MFFITAFGKNQSLIVSILFSILLSLVFVLGGPKEGSFEYIKNIHFEVWFVSLFLSSILWINFLRMERSFKNLFILSVPLMLALISSPIYENDYYRYYYDGISILNDIDPYKIAPIDSQLDYPYKDAVSFKGVKSIYPYILMLLFFAYSHSSIIKPKITS